jgi:5-methylcytosine-specific restriction endonuclease McrA
VGYTGEQKRKYQLAWLAKRRDRGTEILGGKCAICGSTENLEVDHIDPATKDPRIKGNGTGGFPWSWSWIWIEAELAKCQALCSDCHQEKSSREQMKEVCIRGHDKGITGRDTDGNCSECRRENQRKYRHSPLV